MSALTDLFSSMANKIRSKTGTATTYTPSEMASDGIDDVFDAGVASATTSITPSNSSPAAMTANTGYKPTSAGYAIESYSSITPSNSSPVSVYEGSIYKINSSDGYAISSLSYLSPSNSTPATINYGGIYKAQASGKAVASVTDITPSDSTPASMSSGSIYKAGGAGYAIESSPTALAPSDSSPATITSGTIYKASGNGKAVENVNSITPSSSAPSMTSGSIYKAGAAGYAIGSYQSKTPSTSGVSFNAGFVKMASAGIAYSEVPTISTYTLVDSSITPNTRVSDLYMIGSGYAVGKKYLVLLFDARTSGQAYDKMDNAYGSNVTLTKLCNLMNANAPVCGTFYLAQKTAGTATITLPNQGYYMVFEAQ